MVWHTSLPSLAGGQSIVSAESISALLAQAGVRCVVMNSCESDATGTMAVDEATASLASAIHAAGVHIVVGMNRTVTVDAARELFRAFYTELFSGGSALAAARAARSALARKGQSRETASGEVLIRGSDWMIPCIFQSDDVKVARPGRSTTAAHTHCAPTGLSCCQDLRLGQLQRNRPVSTMKQYPVRPPMT